MIKVLHFYKTFLPDSFAGVSRVIYDISKGCLPLGIESTVISLSSDVKEVQETEFDGIRVVRCPTYLEVASSPFSIPAFSVFNREAQKADLINIHYPWPFADLVYYIFGHGKPLIITYHSDIVRQRITKKLYFPLMRQIFGKAEKIFVTSNNLLQSSDTLNKWKNKTQIIELGINEEDVPSVEADSISAYQEKYGRFFCFIGAFRYYKGLEYLIRAAPDVPVPILLIGDGEEKPRLMALAEEVGARNVVFLGALDDLQKTEVLNASYAFVLPSHLRSEAFGLVLVEAAMASKPMISCELGTGTSFINLDGETGIVVKAADPEALSQAMMLLLKDTALHHKFSIAARERYLKFFTGVRMSAKYAAEYRKILLKQSKGKE